MKFDKFDAGSMWPTIFDAVGFGLVLVDADARVLLWNGWLARHSGVSAETALGQPLASVFGEGLAPSFATALNNVLQYKLKRGNQRVGFFSTLLPWQKLEN